ncbi:MULTISPECIES: AraC family transcriptional regulator [unclassified Mesorhizobium]|uniref:AraC family transcriptional regulator n=1 Tax=unclassified Mesorhizobium TaxID=325217 RepID=UPI000F75A4CC|nr:MULTISPECIES: AraC family transcriptional regulator [unclassified Mesorhizobium]AZO06755.1 AraC family transcriptional regulator [Mesorhizobium sp. M2A.F.Ca.ET.043.02.1.1]RUW40660.1 AraC family transcriptional regulator [Mesorhizobium sp. M2A.F.Ca.ET.015.02.1.1]RVD10811.1 AraC family transcriptional regulator [Mesorhizobium sp. M2A.F.Ca.ET.029.05.1.1]RWB42528.1 MAG: AraC family transcriptional regulator [Mesorhizobium sp.]RWB61140.1 MAG: AraC family transcriptional regulator [Mesorhizobium 
MNSLPNPIEEDPGRKRELVELAGTLAERIGYNATAIESVRVLRTEAVLHDVPVLYEPGAVFVLQGSKRGILEQEVYLYDEEHYLAVSVPVPFRMESMASPDRPLLAVYVEFDMRLAAEIAGRLETHSAVGSDTPQSLISSMMEADIEDVLLRLLKALRNPAETAVLGSGLLRELHYRVLIGPQGGAMIAALQQRGRSGRIVRSLAWLRENYSCEISVADLAREAGMSVPSYHVHFREMTGSSPMQYVKAMRLHEARLMIARKGTIAQAAASVGYASAAQFSRDFKRHFGRTASEEMNWVRRHLGELAWAE